MDKPSSSHPPPTSVAALIERIEAGLRPKFVFFWGHTGEPGRVGPECLSQWYPAPFVIGEHTFPTAEHYMMFSKAKLFGDTAVAAEILQAGSPGKAKALGRQVKGFEEQTWAQQRFDTVVAGNVAKFRDNPPLSDYLARTGERVLVEASPRDRIWGIGLGRDNPSAREPSQWNGLNLLGFALMKTRYLISER